MDNLAKDRWVSTKSEYLYIVGVQSGVQIMSIMISKLENKKEHSSPGSKWRTYAQDKMDQAFPLHFCILQVIKNWTVGRAENEATQNVSRNAP